MGNDDRGVVERQINQTKNHSERWKVTRNQISQDNGYSLLLVSERPKQMLGQMKAKRKTQPDLYRVFLGNVSRKLKSLKRDLLTISISISNH